MKTRKAQIIAITTRIAKLDAKTRRSAAIKEAVAHLDNAADWTRRSDYHWTEAVDEASNIVSHYELPNFLDNALDQIVSVYSGRPGCACGCRGKHSTDKKTIKLIVNKMLKIQPVIERNDNHFYVETDTRLYIAYVK